MEKRIIIAIVLSFLVFFGFNRLMAHLYPEYGQTQTQTEAPAEPAVPNILSSTELTNAAPAAGTPGAVSPDLAKDVHHALKNDLYDLVVSERYGSIIHAGFWRFSGHNEKNEPLVFIKTEEGRAGIGGMDIWANGVYQVPVNAATTVAGNEIRYVTTAGGLNVEKNIHISKNAYGNTLSLSLKNSTAQDIKVKFRLSAGSGLVAHSTIDTQYDEANWIDGQKITHTRYTKPEKPKTSEKFLTAVSIKTRHFSSILKPSGKTTYAGFVQGFERPNFASYLLSPEITIPANGQWSDDFILYVGPNRVEDLQPHQLDQVVNFGKLDPICKLFVGALQLIAKITRNYGVAIILLTLFLNILLMPLTKASFMSMRRMQLVQPEMTKMREKYKDNPTKMNQEMMDLYKKHKVNPMGGCLPMIAQMPIFIALYVALSKATELLGARFLWVDNLASPDRVPLPFTLPVLGNEIHLLPLIMVVAMTMQQKISMSQMPQMDPAMAQQQKIMMIFMPIFFGFIFYPMPSGLVIYWLTNTITMTLYQAFLRSQAVTPVARKIS